MKKLLSLLLAVCLLISLAACSGSDQEQETSEADVPKSEQTGTAGSNIPLKDNLRIALITRRGVIIVPTGDDYLSVGDTAVIVTAQSSRFAVLNDIFREAPRGGRL